MHFSLCEQPDAVREELLERFQEELDADPLGACATKAFSLCVGSQCIEGGDEDGRFSCTIGGVGAKWCFGYQLAALQKHDNDDLLLLPSVKKHPDDLGLSHLCGNQRCWNKDHIRIEPKWVNETRKHCHYVITDLMAEWAEKHPGHTVQQWDAKLAKLVKAICRHDNDAKYGPWAWRCCYPDP